jgi:hypothetical protein
VLRSGLDLEESAIAGVTALPQVGGCGSGATRAATPGIPVRVRRDPFAFDVMVAAFGLFGQTGSAAMLGGAEVRDRACAASPGERLAAPTADRLTWHG